MKKEFTKDQIIEAIKEIRRREDKHHQNKIWCSDRNLKLDCILEDAIENELRKVCSYLEDKFDTGFVGYK